MTKASKHREMIVDYLLDHGWIANKETYREVDDRGGYKYGGNFLISIDGVYALTVKSTVFTVHQVSRSYCKVLSVSLKDLEILEDGLQAGLLKLCNPKKEISE